MSVNDTRKAYAERLGTIFGLHVWDSWPDTNEINLPCAWVHGPLTRTLDTFDGGVTRTWEIMLVVASSEDQRRRSQAKLDQYLDEDGDQSIIAAIDDDQTTVTGWADYGVIEVNAEIGFWGAKFELSEVS